MRKKKMSKFEKIKAKIKNGQSISYADAEGVLTRLGFSFRSKGSHHVFSKDGYPKNISIKKCSELLNYQLDLLVEALEYYEE
jgi:predicted RNA binding protein YcfA (HicA-like mRNA interferase family)